MSAPGDYRQLLQQATLKLGEMQQKLAASERARTEPIAIVGMGCRYPGNVNSPAEFWELLHSGRDAVGEIPRGRWDVDALYDADSNHAGTVYTRHAALLDQRTIEDFDPQFFGIAPREAVAMDPQQRLLLEVCWDALEHAGIPASGLRGSATGLYVGMCTDDYLHLHNNLNAPERIDGYTSLGTARSIAVGRVSYLFGWEGPAIQLDTACSSALMAVHLACQNLRAGECDVALAGAVNFQLSPVWTVGLCRLKALSPDGRCRAFDADANGFVRGEGVGMVVLKRLSDAVRDHDNIMAVVRGAAVNHDGKSGGLTVPNERAQQKLLAAALANARLKPADVDYIEAHGTGTLLGDPIEMGALKSVYAAGRDASHPLLVGSVKTNIGHLEGAAGVASLMKVVLAMQHGELPGSLHFHRPNPLIPWNEFAVEVPTQITPWPAKNNRRIAGISAFGFSGTNVHLIVESPPAVNAATSTAERPVPVLPLSAKTSAALNDVIRAYVDSLAKHPGKPLADWAFTAGTGRSHFGHRVAVVAETTDAARALLHEFLDNSQSRNATSLVSGDCIAEPHVAWLFPGDSRPTLRSASLFFALSEAFREAWGECCRWAADLPDDVVTALKNRGGAAWDQLLTSPATAQPALFIHQYCLAQMWRSFGAAPALVAGRGTGAYVATVTAGVLSLADGLKLAIADGRSRQSGSNANFHAALQSVTFRERQIPILSDVTGAMAGAEIGTADYWQRRQAQPSEAVADSVSPLRSKGMTFAVEMGVRGSFAEEITDIPRAWSLESVAETADAADLAALSRGAAELYVHGVDVDWKRFDVGVSRRREDLPTYPFQRVRLWLEPEPGPMAPSPRTKTAAVRQVAAAHPLLGERIESAADFYLFQRHAAPQTDGLWRDHAIYGQPVLPATGYLEMAVAAAMHSSPGANRHWEVRGLSIEKALKFPAAIPGESSDPDVTVQTILTPMEQGFEFRVFSRRDGETSWTRHAAAQVCEAERIEEPPRRDLTALQAAILEPVSLDLQYAEFQKTGLELGPRFRALHQVLRGDGETLSEIRLPECLLADIGEYRIHPVLLDAALQGLSAVIPRAGMYLPVGVERLTIHAPLGTTLWSHAQLDAAKPAPGRGLSARIELFNDSGQIVCVLEGVQFREVSREALGRSPSADSPSHRYQREWRSKPLAGESRLTQPSRWLILDDEAGIGATLAKLLRFAGHQCIQVTPGEKAGPIADDRVVLPANDAGALADFLHAQNGQPNSWAGVIHLWGLRDSEAGQRRQVSDAFGAIPDQSLSCGTALAIVQALVRKGESPRVYFVTRQGQSVAKDGSDRVEVGQAPLWGLGQVITLEHPELSCQCIDVDEIGPGECAEILWREVQAADAEDQVAYRRSERFVARLVPAQNLAAKFSVPEHPYRVQLPAYGLLDTFRAEKITRRTPLNGEVELEIRAAGLNFRDVLRALGMLQAYETSLGIHAAGDAPFGFEAAGVITAVGADVKNFAVGDEVVVLEAGALASHMTVAARHVVKKPENLSFTEAAAAPLAFVTAYHALADLAQVRAGQRVLIHAAAGGVGLAAVQLALRAGAEVYATASPAKWDTLRALGVRLVANSRTTDFADQVLQATGGAGVDIVLNSLNGDFIPASLKALAHNGVFLEIGKIGIWSPEQVAASRPDVVFRAFDLGEEERKAPGFNGRLLTAVLDRFHRRELTPLPLKTFPIDEISAAFQWMSRAKHIGKVVVALAPGANEFGPSLNLGPGTYLVTGGLGGLGLLVSQWLARQGVKSLALVGRRPAESADQQRVLSELHQQGCTVRCYAADISVAGDVARVLRTMQADLPPLSGIIHAAGVLDDGSIRNQTWARWEAVFAPKAFGAWHLHTQTRHLPLKQFVCFSSAVSVIGSAGQANYAAANAFVDALAYARRQAGLPALTINWGAWKGAGMAAQLSVRERERLASLGLGLIDPFEGLQQLGELMTAASADDGPAQVAVLPIDWNRYAAAAGRRPLWSELTGEVKPAVVVRSEFLVQWDAAPPSDRPRLLQAFVRGQLAKVLGLDSPQSLAADLGFFDLGMDSLTSVEFANRLQDSLGCKLPTTVAFDHPTINDLSEFLMSTIPTSTPDVRVPPTAMPAERAVSQPASSIPAEEGIAIVGMSCRFPGCDPGPDAYWDFLMQGGDAIGDVPKDRWDADRMTDLNPEAPGKMTSRKGGFLRGPLDQFDAAFFGISPREARSLDPQQRLLLETTYEALEDAGIPLAQVEKTATGVFVGIAGSDCLMLFARNRDAIDAYFGTGTTHSTAAGRLSYTFGFQGPAISVDTACSSGLVAIHLACQSLKSGECDMAVAAGVNLVIAPEVCINFSKAKMLSPDGHCKSFDASANGYVRGEGIGALLLKPLSKAQADGNRILAVIRGSAINQDGRSGGLTVPSGPAQEAVLRQAMHAAGVTADDVDYLEAHGTGTPLGDPIELGAIGAVYRSRQGEPLTVCSVKANIGHLETASGIAGLIKVIQAFRHETIPPQLHFQTPNSKVDWSQLPISIPGAARPWPTGPRPRIAGVSAFGFSGTNAHLIVEEPPAPVIATAPASPPAELKRPLQLLPLSAKSESALKSLAKSYRARLEGCSDDEFANICHTAATGRTHFAYRLAVAGANAADAIRRLDRYQSGESDPLVHTGYIGDEPQLAFLFTGQGSQYADMGKMLFETQPTFRRALEQCDELLRPHLSEPLLSVLFADPSNGLLNQTAFTQPALFSLEYALCQMWNSWGIRPRVMLGHSVGEYAAACAAGVLSLEDALTLIATRARLIQSLPAGGGMLAVMAPEDQVRPFVDQHQPSISFAAINGPRQVVLSGPIPLLDRLEGELAGIGAASKRLTVSHAFHSSLMEPILNEFRAIAANMPFAAPQIPIISNVTAQTVTSQTLGTELRTADYWCTHLRQAVQFVRSVQELAKSPCDVLLEVGPQPTLLGMAKQSLSGDKHLLLASLKPRTSEWETVLSALSQLYVRGADIDWAGFDRDYRREQVTVPHYHFQRQRHWPEWLTAEHISTNLMAKPAGQEAAASSNGAPMAVNQPTPLLAAPVAVSAAMSALEHPFLGGRLQLAGDHLAYQAELSAEAPSYLADHSVFGRPLFPGTGYMETALAAGHQLPGTQPVIVEDLDLLQGLPLPKGAKVTVQIVLDGTGSERRLQFFSRAAKAEAGDPWQMQATATIRRAELPAVSATNLEAIRQRCGKNYDMPKFYADFLKAGLQYGPCFQGVTQLRGGSAEAIGDLRLPAQLASDAALYYLHPALLDAALQVIAAAVDGTSATYLPVGLETLRFYHRLPAQAVCHVRLRDPDAADAAFLLADIKVMDSTGHALAVLQGLKLKRVNLPTAAPAPAAKPSLAQRVDWLHEYAWRAQPLAKDAPGVAANGSWLVFADDSDVGALLSGQLQSRGARCVIVSPGAAYRQLNAEQFELNAADPAGFQRLLQVAVGPQQPPLTGVAFLWGLARPAGESVDGMDSLAVSLGGAMHLVQALHAAESHPRVWLVTRGGQGVTGQELVSASEAALWGLGRVIAVEHADLRCTRIDLDPSADEVSSVQLLVKDLLQGDDEDQLAYRNGARWAARLVQQSAKLGRLTIPADAYRLKLAEYGSLDQFSLAPLERTAPGPGEIEVAVDASGLNFRDVLRALGMLQSYEIPLGITSADLAPFGFEFAGRVSAVGAGVTDLAVGDEVLGVNSGTLRSHLVCSARLVVRKPKELTASAAASIPLAYLTATYALDHLARLRPGDKVLIHAAAGGVGQAAVQIARRAGATIFATASPGKWDFLREQGIEHIFDSRSTEFGQQVLKATNGHGVDVVLNSLNGDYIPSSVAALAPQGRFVEIGKIGIWTPEQMARSRPDVKYWAFDLGELEQADPGLMQKLLNELMPDFASGKLRPLPTRLYSMEDAVTAFREMQQAKHRGKLVLAFDQSLLDARPLVRDDSSYLITGGLGGLGLALADRLVQRGARHLVLAGRKGAETAAQQAVLAKLEAGGAKVAVVMADAGEPADIARLIAAAQALAPLKGVFHAAGAIDDGRLTQQSWSRFERILRPKAIGAEELHRQTRDLDLDLFVTFSSAASMIGSYGQSNYAAANAYLDGLAWRRHGEGLPAVSINWGPWGGQGMAARMDQRDLDRMALSGWSLIGTEEGLDLLERIVRGDSPQVGVLPVEWSTFLSVTGAIPMLREVSAGSRSGEKSSFVAELETLNAAERRDLMLNFVRDRIASVLGSDNSDWIQPRDRLFDLGMDSLTAVELQNTLQRELGLILPTTMAFDFPTIEALAEYLSERVMENAATEPADESPLAPQQPAVMPLPPPVIGTGQPTAHTVAQNDDAEQLKEFEQMSDEEVSAMLLSNFGDLLS